MTTARTNAQGVTVPVLIPPHPKQEDSIVTTPDRWVLDLYRAVDSMDAGTLAKAFADDGTFRPNGRPNRLMRDRGRVDEGGWVVE